jgi:hypothetical protein
MSSPTPQNEAPSQPSAYYPEHLKEMWSEITTMNNHLFTIRQGQVEQKGATDNLFKVSCEIQMEQMEQKKGTGQD